MGEVVRVDEKGRILIPISIRNTLGIEKGVKLVLEIRGVYGIAREANKAYQKTVVVPPTFSVEGDTVIAMVV